MQRPCHGITEPPENPPMSCHGAEGIDTPRLNMCTRSLQPSCPSLAPRAVPPDRGTFIRRTRRHTLAVRYILHGRKGGSSLHQGQEPVGGTPLAFLPSNGRSVFCKMAATSRSESLGGCRPACKTRYCHRSLPHACCPPSLGRIPHCRCPQYQTQLSGAPNATWRQYLISVQ
jgi:hypothetical protein